MQSPIKIHGGKGMLVHKLLPLIPKHTTYLEPFAGGASVFFAKEFEGVNEVLCDADSRIANLYRSLQNPLLFEQFKMLVETTGFHESFFECANANPLLCNEMDWYGINVVKAWKFFILSRMSMSGRRETFAPPSLSRRRRGMNEQVSAWLTAIEGLSAVHKRLQRAYVLNGDGIALIPKFDIEGSFIYADPPYHPSTRSSVGEYEVHEMNDTQHRALLGALGGVKNAKFALSGYRCELYDQAQEQYLWKRLDFPVKNHSGVGPQKESRVESVWMNYEPSESLPAN